MSAATRSVSAPDGVCPAVHKHGETGTCYVAHKCRCDNCRTGNRVRAAARRRAHLYGRFDNPYIDAEPVREHVLSLMRDGMGYRRIAEVSGVGATAVRTLIYGRQDPGPRNGEELKRIHRDKAAKLRGITPELHLLCGGARMPSTGTVRRLQALVTMGWSQAKLGLQLGITPGNFTTLMSSSAVTVRRHREVADLYERLWQTPPPKATSAEAGSVTRARRYARQRRWLPPLAWDDIDTDQEPPIIDSDSTSAVDDVVVQLVVAGDAIRLNKAERRAVVTELYRLNLSDQAIADRSHMAARTVLRIREELHLKANHDAAGPIAA